MHTKLLPSPDNHATDPTEIILEDDVAILQDVSIRVVGNKTIRWAFKIYWTTHQRILQLLDLQITIWFHLYVVTPTTKWVFKSRLHLIQFKIWSASSADGSLQLFDPSQTLNVFEESNTWNRNFRLQWVVINIWLFMEIYCLVWCNCSDLTLQRHLLSFKSQISIKPTAVPNYR